jgi:SHS family lactate transporter-like MFS transporter
LTFVLKDIAKEFGIDVVAVAYALFLTLAMRFVGAFIFGRIGDHFGRKPALMLVILAYSIIRAAAAFSPSLWVFLFMRALFGVAMGGEWGLGSSLAMESIPPGAHGTVSGILQCGYPSGFLLAAVAYGLLYGRTIGDYTIGWLGDVLVEHPARLLGAVHPRRGAGIAGVRGRAEPHETEPVADDHG